MFPLVIPCVATYIMFAGPSHITCAMYEWYAFQQLLEFLSMSGRPLVRFSPISLSLVCLACFTALYVFLLRRSIDFTLPSISPLALSA